jgi:hypothetical protein
VIALMGMVVVLMVEPIRTTVAVLRLAVLMVTVPMVTVLMLAGPVHSAIVSRGHAFSRLTPR